MTPISSRASSASWKSTSRSPSPASGASASTCSTSAVIRRWCCATSAPTCPKLDQLGLPDMFKDLIMMKRGLILMVGATGSGKSTSHRGDDQPPQRELVGSHRHHRGSDRVPAHQQALDRESARSRPRHQVVRARVARRDARRARRHPHRRNPRQGDHGGGDQPVRHRPPGAVDAARQQQRRDAGSHHQHVPAGSAQADLPRPVAVPARHPVAAPGRRPRTASAWRRSKSCSTRRTSASW